MLPQFGGPTPPPGAVVVVPPDAMTLNVSNGSTLQVSLVVNGQSIETIDAGDGRFDIPAGRLPPQPWDAQVRSPSGRVLLEVTVDAGDVWRQVEQNGHSSSSGTGARVDLSCGRIDLWSGPGILGPAPGPGVPGDCAP